MTLGRGEVHEATVADQVQRLPSASVNSSTSARSLPGLDRELPERGDLDLGVEVTRVGEDRAVLHPLHVCARDALVPGGRAEDVAHFGRLLHRQDLEPSGGLERRTGSTSVTMTCAPMPRARCATPRPTQP